MVYLDTHSFVWLYAGEIERFSKASRRALEFEDLRISPVVLLEAEYLHEIGRLKKPAATMFHYLSDKISLRQCGLPFANVVHFSLGEKWTRDVFDRLIVSHARLSEAELVTKDEQMHAHYELCCW